MKSCKVLVLRTAGTNCDYETVYAFRKVGAEVELLHIKRIFENKSALHRFHILAIPGGFSYGDDIASGKVLANELRYNLAEHIEKFIADGKLIIGICNGFQVLVKAGFLPMLGQNHRATLTFNDSNRFEDRWVYLKVMTDKCVFIQPNQQIYLPVAHAEGKFVPENDETLRLLEQNGQIVFKYVKPDGTSGGYPWNPNGSIADIAGICDPTGRILGMMPHPERHVEPTQHPRWTREGLKPEGDGLQIFRNAVNYATEHLL